MPSPSDLKLFGACQLERSEQPVTGPAVQPRRLALLALLATVPRFTLSRERVLAYLWPEHSTEQGRHILNVSVHVIRRECGQDAIQSVSGSLRLDPALIRPDTLSFETALENNDFERAAALFQGPFMDGFFIDGAPEFAEWQDQERRRFATRAAEAVETMATQAEVRGELARALLWWERRFAEDPGTARVAIRLMRVLERLGDRARAVAIAQRHCAIVRDEFGVDPHPELVAEMERIRESPSALPETPAPRPDRLGSEDDVTTAISESNGALPRPDSPDASDAATSGSATVPRPRSRRWAVAMLVSIVLVSATAIAFLRSQQTLAGAAGEATSPAVRPARDSIAFDHYTRGRFLWNQRNEASLLNARAEFDAAIAIDSTYAEAWSGLADTYLLLPSYGGEPARVGFARAWDAARTAVQLDSTLAETRTSLAQAMTEYARDRREAERHFSAAITADPSYATARHWYALFLASERRIEEALDQIAAAREIDPLSRIIAAAVGATHYLARDWPAAVSEYRGALALQPDFARGHALLGRAQLGAGDGAGAIASLERAVGLSGGDPGYRLLLAHALAATGRVRDARANLDSLGVDERSGAPTALPVGVEPFSLAAVWVALGESQIAFRLLEQAVDEYDTGIEYLNADPRFDLLRSNPRFQRLLDRLGF